MIKNYYKILHVHPDADPEIIEVAFRRLAQKYHPDINKNENSSSLMADINEAHQILSNPESRKKYDNERKLYLRERKKERLETQNIGNKPSSPSRWLQNLNTWCVFSEKQRIWILSERKLIETTNLQLQKFISDIQEFYKLNGYGFLQTLQRSFTEADIVIEGRNNKKVYVVHVDITNNEIGVDKIRKFKSEIQKANFAQGAFFTLGYFTKEAITFATSNSVKLVNHDSFTKSLYEARNKQKHS